MDHATQVALLQRIFRFFDERTTELAPSVYINDVGTYTEPAQLEQERAVLFRRGPLFFGLSHEVAEPGAYRTADVAGVPVLVVRTRAGTLRAFVAICRHRGAPIVSGGGMGNGRFTCPYHGCACNAAGRRC